jgi:ATP-binding cassette subfamily B protein
MKILGFIQRLFKDYPLLLILNIFIFLFLNLIEAASILSLVTVVDLFLNPSLNGISSITQQVVIVFTRVGLPATLAVFLAIFLLFAIIKTILQIFSQYLVLKTKYKVCRGIIVGTFEDFFNARWYFFSSGKQGTLLNTFTREITMVGEAFGSIARYFSSILQILLFLLLPLYMSWQVTGLTMIIALLFALPFTFFGRLSYRLGLLNTTTANEMGKVISEGLNSAKIILGFGNQSKIVQVLKYVYDNHCRVTIKSQTLSLSLPLTYYPLGLLVLVIGLFLSKRFSLPVSETIVLFYSLSRVMPLIGAIAELKSRLDNYLPSYEQVEGLRARSRELRQESGGEKFIGFSDRIKVENLTFAYPKHKPVLVDINMVIPKGKMVAIVGESGAGKSTLIDMIMHFHESSSGRITFDGVDLSSFDIISYRRRIGYVPQDIILFNMTIRDNLLWANENASDEEIGNACALANAEEFIHKLPDAYNTLVGDRGVRLSGGQAQRIALARAILRKPELLILDEATSALDTASERMFQLAIEKIAKGTTVIAVAHRLSTIVNADYIYVLKDGRIAEEGTYPELVQRNGGFKKMIELQTLALTNGTT